MGYIKNLKIHYVERVEDVLKIALLQEKVKRPLNLSLSENRQLASLEDGRG